MGRPTQHTFPLSPFVGGRATRVRYAIPEPHTPLSSGRGGGVAARDRVAAVIAAGTRPDLSFPNPEAKTASADGTAPARVWESRTPPPTPQEKGGARPAAPPFLVACHRTHAAAPARPGPRTTTRPATRPPAGRQPPHRQTPRQTTNTHTDAVVYKTCV